MEQIKKFLRSRGFTLALLACLVAAAAAGGGGGGPAELLQRRACGQCAPCGMN